MRVERCFAFVDLCGFTAFIEHFGDERTVVVLANFRTRVREIAARRGVRVTKWLGDGAMLSSEDTQAVVSMVLELGVTVPESVPSRSGPEYPAGRSSCSKATTTSAGPPTWPPGCATPPGPARCWPPGRWSATSLAGWPRARPASIPAQGFDRPLEASLISVGTADVMVTDPCCGLVLPLVTGLDTRFGPDGSIQRFCSTACALSWEENQRQPAARTGPSA